MFLHHKGLFSQATYLQCLQIVILKLEEWSLDDGGGLMEEESGFRRNPVGK